MQIIEVCSRRCGSYGRFLSKVRDIEKTDSNCELDEVRPYRRKLVKSIMKYM